MLDKSNTHTQKKDLWRARLTKAAEDCGSIGRNNWLFSDTEDGTHASSLLYSLGVTAYLSGVNPYTAFKVLFEALPQAKTLEDYERLAEFILPGNLTSEK